MEIPKDKIIKKVSQRVNNEEDRRCTTEGETERAERPKKPLKKKKRNKEKFLEQLRRDDANSMNNLIKNLTKQRVEDEISQKLAKQNASRKTTRAEPYAYNVLNSGKAIKRQSATRGYSRK